MRSRSVVPLCEVEASPTVLDVSTRTSVIPGVESSAVPLLRLLQLVSPSLPTGAFAYSQGLETLVDLGWVRGEEAALRCLAGLMGSTLERLELPILQRMHLAWLRGDVQTVSRWGAWLLAARESGELQAQERQMARALTRVLEALVPAALNPSTPTREAPRPGVPGRDISSEDAPSKYTPRTFCEAFSCAAASFRVPVGACLLGYAYNWCETHVTTLSRILPLGPISSQLMLDRLLPRVPAVVEGALAVTDGAIGAATPGIALASALHETQHTRLFRS